MSSHHSPPPPAAGTTKPPGRSALHYDRSNHKKNGKLVYRVKETKSDKVLATEESPPPPPPSLSLPASEKSQYPESSSSHHRYISEEKTESVDIVKETKSDKVVGTEESSPPSDSEKYQSPKSSSSQEKTEFVNIVKEVKPDKVVKAEENSDQQRNDGNVRTKDSGFWHDICPRIVGPKLNPSLHVGKKEMREDENRTISINVLRPGMIHLKQFLSLNEQVKVIRKCRELGIGPGGFYQPGYADGAKLRLKMMCLGKNWDPETGKYGETRACDGSKAPPVPEEFLDLVQRAINDSHSHLVEKKKVKRANVENVLPSMKPDLCIVNFYSTTGRLGLHRDKDESPESLLKGLPVVSFSIGDSAEFLHGDSKDVEAEKVVLKSGDVLIFGGKARHVFHGVSTVFPNSAPKYLSAVTNIRPGRLNLTFRQY